MTNFKSIPNLTNFKYYKLFPHLRFAYLKICLLICLFAYLFICLLPKSVSAQTSRSFTISPPSVKFKLNPGEKAEKIFKITNNTNEPLAFFANVQDFIVTDNIGTPELLPADLVIDNKFAASHWATVITDTLTVHPGKSNTAVLYLQVPGNARPGGRYISVAFKPTAEDLPEGTGASVNTVAGSIVYLTVNGETTENGRVTAFGAPLFSEFGPITLSTKIENSGDNHINPKGQIVIKNIFGQKIYTTALDSRVNIFPGVERVYQNVFAKKWLFGPYKAVLAGYFGQNDSLPLSAVASFWVIPYKIILIIIALIVIGIILYKKSQKKEEVNPPQTS